MADENRQDPRFRRFRVASLAVYLVLTFAFSSMIIWSVFRSVFAMTPKAPQTTTVSTVSKCASDARGLFEALETRHRELLGEPNVAASDVRWAEFRLGWLTRLKEVEAGCDLSDPSREKLKAALRQMNHVLDLYTVHAVQYAGEIGPTLDATRILLADVEK